MAGLRAGVVFRFLLLVDTRFVTINLPPLCLLKEGLYAQLYIGSLHDSAIEF